MTVARLVSSANIWILLLTSGSSGTARDNRRYFLSLVVLCFCACSEQRSLTELGELDAKYTHLGCFNDVGTDRVLTLRMKHDDMTPSVSATKPLLLCQQQIRGRREICPAPLLSQSDTRSPVVYDDLFVIVLTNKDICCRIKGRLPAQRDSLKNTVYRRHGRYNQYSTTWLNLGVAS